MAKILLLEDVEYCRRFYRVTLVAHGYTVVAATDADEARRCCAENPDIALIVAEAALGGGKEGKTAAETLAAQLGGARILYVSAYPLEHLLEAGVVHLDSPHQRAVFLAKPFSARALLDAVRGVLADRAACV